MDLNMCLLASKHLPLASRFSRVSSTWGEFYLGFVTFFSLKFGSVNII